MREDNAIAIIEQRILAACRTTVESMAGELAERGLVCEAPELKVFNPNPTNYSSEVRAMILRDGQIVDALEFFVFHHGQVSITPEEAQRYTREVLLDAAEHS